MRCAVFASDERMLILIDILKGYDYKVDTLKNERDLKNNKNKIYDFIVLPISGVSDEGFIFNYKIGLYITDFLLSLSKNTKIFTGKSGYVIKSYFSDVKVYLDDVMLLNKNSLLTAQGLLCSIISNTSKSMYDYNYKVIGYGMCGRYIVELLDMLNLNVTVITTTIKNNDFRYNYTLLNDLNCDDDNTIMINTAPVCVIDQNVVEKFKYFPMIFDISTNNVGVHPLILNKYTNHCVFLPSLPSKYSPYSAAECIAEFIKRGL